MSERRSHMLSTRGGEPRAHSVSRARQNSREWGRPLAPLERSEAGPTTTAFSDRLHSLLEHRVDEQMQADRSACPPALGPPQANPTAARSCDCTAVSAYWPPPGAPAPSSLLRLPSPALQLRRCRPMRWHFIDALPPLSSSPRFKEGGKDLTGQMSSEAPFPFTNH